MHGLPYSLKKAVAAGNVVGRYVIPVSADIDVVATGAAVGFGGTPVFTIPADLSKAHIVSANLYVGFAALDANVVATWNGDVAVGSTLVDAVTFDATDQDLIPQSVVGPAVGGETSNTLTSIATLDLGPLTSDTLFLNMLIDAADISDDTTGVIRVKGHLDLQLGLH